MSQPNEASVEEILESIKKVISRDNRSEALEIRRRREKAGVVDISPAVESNSAEDNDEGTELLPDSSESSEADSEEVLDLGEMEFVEDTDKPAEETEVAIEAATELDDNAPLTTDKARVSMRENLEALAMLAQPSAPPQIVRSGETSLEGLTKELLRPMLAEWLDSNLPDMVEGLVKEEIARIARKDRD